MQSHSARGCNTMLPPVALPPETCQATTLRSRLVVHSHAPSAGLPPSAGGAAPTASEASGVGAVEADDAESEKSMRECMEGIFMPHGCTKMAASERQDPLPCPGSALRCQRPLVEAASTELLAETSCCAGASAPAPS